MLDIVPKIQPSPVITDKMYQFGYGWTTRGRILEQINKLLPQQWTMGYHCELAFFLSCCGLGAFVIQYILWLKDKHGEG